MPPKIPGTSKSATYKTIDIEEPNASQHKLFEEDMEMGLKRKQAADNHEQNSGQISSTKRPKKINWTKNGLMHLQQTWRKEPKHDRIKPAQQKLRQKPRQREQPCQAKWRVRIHPRHQGHPRHHQSD